MNDLENQARVDALLAGPKADKSKAKQEVFAGRARTVKAEKLCDALVAEADGDLGEARELAYEYDHDAWCQLAKEHGVNKPSEATVELTIQTLGVRIACASYTTDDLLAEAKRIGATDDQLVELKDVVDSIDPNADPFKGL